VKSVQGAALVARSALIESARNRGARRHQDDRLLCVRFFDCVRFLRRGDTGLTVGTTGTSSRTCGASRFLCLTGSLGIASRSRAT
jgi:hypothetical protein